MVVAKTEFGETTLEIYVHYKYHTPRANLRHNAKDYIQSSNADGESLELGDEDANLGRDDHGVHDDTAKDQNEPKPKDDHPDDQMAFGLNQIKSRISKSKDYCWMAVNSEKHFNAMDEVYGISPKITNQYKTLVNSSNFDEEMLEKMLETRSIAERTLQNFGGAAHNVPAGLNLGGYEMIRQPQSILFFHRLKLRNDTRFSVNYLHNDLQNMTLTVRISMHDMHLVGDYERALTLAKEPNSLFYRPTSGKLEFLLRDVEYKMEGRYRLLYDRLNLEHIISEVVPKDVALKFTAEHKESFVKLETSTIQEYLLRMQNDLDSWLLDYFNDFLIFFGLGGATASSEFKAYQNQRTMELNRFADEVLEHTRLRLQHQNASTVMIPSFNLLAVNGWKIKLSNGVIRGLDSIRRQSVATGRRDGNTRLVNAVARFSFLKVEYDYEMFVMTGLPSLLGKLVLTADGLTVRMDVRAVKENDEIDLNFKLLKEPPYQSLTIVGSANRVIASFKHLLEHQIIAIMSNSLAHNIHKIGSVTRCHISVTGRYE